MTLESWNKSTGNKDVGAWPCGLGQGGESTFMDFFCLPSRRHPFCDEDIYLFHPYPLRDEGVGTIVVDRCYLPWGT